MVGFQTQGVVNKRGIALAAEVLAGLEREWGIIGLFKPPVVLIRPLQQMRHPSDVVLGGHQLQAWKPLQYTGKDKDEERMLNFVRPDHKVDPKLSQVAFI